MSNFKFRIGEKVRYAQGDNVGEVRVAYTVRNYDGNLYDVLINDNMVHGVDEQILSSVMNTASRDDENITMHYNDVPVPSRVSTHWLSSWGELWREGVDNALALNNTPVVVNALGLRKLKDSDGDKWYELEAGKWTMEDEIFGGGRKSAERRRENEDSFTDRSYTDIVTPFGPIKWIREQ